MKPLLTRLTNAQIGDLIDGLANAIENNKTLIDSNMPPKTVPRNSWSQEDKDLFEEWRSQIQRWRKLRKMLLAHERRA